MRYIKYNNTLGLKYYSDLDNAPISDPLRQASIKTENKLVDLYYSNFQYCPDTGRIAVACIIFYQCVPIDHDTHIPGPVAQ